MQTKNGFVSHRLLDNWAVWGVTVTSFLLLTPRFLLDVSGFALENEGCVLSAWLLLPLLYLTRMICFKTSTFLYIVLNNCKTHTLKATENDCHCVHPVHFAERINESFTSP